MDQVTVNDTAQRFVEKINDNFEEAGIASSLSYASAAGDFVDALNAKFGQPTSPVSTGDTGSEFVQNINTSFANLSPGDPGETGTILMDMQAGELDRGYSKSYEAYSSSDPVDSDIWNHCHSVEFLNIGEGANPIQSVARQSGETLTIHWLNSDGSHGGSVSSISSIPSNARYVRFQLSSSSPIASDRKLSVTVSREVVRTKNFARRQYQNSDRTYITYEVKKPYKFPVYENDDKTQFYDYIGNDRLYDNGYIVLPNNTYYSYSPTGTPTDLAVFIQGTGGYPFINGNGDGTYKAPQTFLAQNNIAVCCCSGVTSKYPTVENLMFGPLFCESVASMVDYIKANYNIGKVYIYGKSSGGMLTNFAPLVTYIGAVCVGSLAPAFGPITSKLYVGLGTFVRDSIRIVAKDQLGAELPSSITKDKWKESAVANRAKWRMFDGFFSAYTSEQISNDELPNSVDFKDIMEAAFENNVQNSIYGLVTFNSDIRILLERLTRPFPVPHKVWCSENDNAVSYQACEKLRDYSERYTLSKLPSYPTNEHNADTGTTVRYTLPNGSTIDAPIGYAELVDWFKCDGNPSNSN